MSRVEVKLPPVPSELKILAPFISRAQELSGKEPVIAYYCLYHAITTGMSANAKGKDATPFLTSLMTVLETMKDQLKDRKEINSHEAAAVYIETFALKVFSNADNEDRKGGSNRSTAKKFLAASNFFELLSIFDAKHLNPLIQPEEKIKYAKWKAADIAKAYREGRAPQSGPATALDGSEDEFAEIHSHSEVEDASMGSSSGAAVTAFDDSKFSHNQSTKTGATTPPTAASALKPFLSTKESSSSTNTITHTKNPSASLTPTHISTASDAPSPYVIDLSSPVSSGTKTPLKSPGVSDGLWSTAATPGIDSPNVFPGGSGGRAALGHLNPASIALFNATLGAAKGVGGDSPLSPGASPKPKSTLGAFVITANDISASGALRKHADQDGIDTDEEDGQWSTAGNDPFSRQNSMVPLPSSTSFSSGHPPSLTVTSSLGVLHEDVSPQFTPQKQQGNAENRTRGAQNLVTPSALNAPLPPSASNTAPPSPEARPNSTTFAASHPLPSVLPPATRTPSSIKSDSHVLPTEHPPTKNWKITSSVVGDSTSDGEASYNVRRRANSAATGLPPNSAAPKLSAEDRSGLHVRSSSVNTAFISGPGSTISRDAPLSGGKGGSASSADDDWEKASLSRLARLPDSVTGSDMDSLSGRLRDLGGSESESATPTIPDGRMAGAQGPSDFKSRRNTIKANAPYDPQLSGSDFGFTLPAVPSAPPIGDWGNGSGKDDSDSGGEGDVMARMPSAPAIPPLVQDQLPHITVFPKPAIPREHLHVNPHVSTSTPVSSSTAPSHDLESPSTPRTHTNSQNYSASLPSLPSLPSSGQHATSINGPPPPPPPQFGYQQSPHSSSNTVHSIYQGYSTPNSATSPPSNFTTPIPPMPIQPVHPFVSSTSSGMAYPMPPSVYGSNGPVNGFTGEYGPPVNVRPPPTEVDVDTLIKAQKFTKFALSALMFEDLETARNELKKALQLLS